MKNFRHYKESGMTLVEMVVAIGIYTVLSLAIATSVTDLYKVNSYAISQADEINNARRGIIEWSRDVKEMTTAEDGTYPVARIDEHVFGYYSDTDQDSDVEYVEYVLATTTLTKYVYKATGSPPVYSFASPDSEKILSLYVQNIVEATSTFLYYDNSGTQLSSTSPIVDVKFITAKLVVNIDSVRNPGEFLLKASVAPRNLKDNL